jgi:hypothetical protein
MDSKLIFLNKINYDNISRWKYLNVMKIHDNNLLFYNINHSFYE